MKPNYFNKPITATGVTTLIWAVAVGFLTAEILYFSRAAANSLNSYISSVNSELTTLIICGILLILVAAYLYGRGFHDDLLKIMRSGRVDLLIMLVLGLSISVSFEGVGSAKYDEFISVLKPGQLILLSSLPFVVGLLLVLRTLFGKLTTVTEGEEAFFISDVEKKTRKDDLLGFSEESARFAERVLNLGSSASMVFGIDAPWGIGKSSFVNLCKEYWENNHKDKVIVYSFSPLRYEDRSNLLEKFVDGLNRVIQKYSFVPELRPLISKYSRFIEGAKGSFSGFGFEIRPGTYTIDDAFEALEVALSRFEKKIIIVVDDLDRLNFSAIKDVLFAIKKSFTLPNISYVLCYDTENISALEKERPDVEKVTEFLEKFVNVKVSLYLDSSALKNYVSKNLTTALAGNSQADPILVSKAVAGLTDIYDSSDYHRYLPFVGDVRKLKRLINTLLLLEIEKADFENSDFNNHDLIHLLLIYINYPSIFRKIYDSETQGKKGFFSVIGPYEEGYPEDLHGQGHSSAGSKTYKNSVEYTTYRGKLPGNQQFLLNKVFDVSQRLEDATIDSVPTEIKHSYACFNGGWAAGNNLEEYLNLIVKLSKPQKQSQYRFYLNCKNEIASGRTIENVLAKAEFSYSTSESSHEQLWRVITNSSHEFDSRTGSQLITYLLNNIQYYSLFTNKDIGVGLRDDLDFFIIKLLDTVGWSHQNGQHRNNTEEYVAEIAEWIFGEGRHVGSGVIETLSSEDKGVLGLYDLLVFRLYCSADRGGHFFNLQRSLSKHGDPNAPTSGLTTAIAIEEMREISQRVFQLFNDQYIIKNRNIFELIDNLTLADLAGKYLTFVEEKITSGVVRDVDAATGALKSRVKAFTTYQLGNALVSSGVGCGYYDPAGKEDKHGIKSKINEYFFDLCFNPTKDPKNYERFIDYLLINFASTFPSDGGRSHVPHIGEFTKVLDKKKLAEYWKANSTAIRALNLAEKSKEIVTGNYTVSYKDEIAAVYKVLDDHVVAVESEP